MYPSPFCFLSNERQSFCFAPLVFLLTFAFQCIEDGAKFLGVRRKKCSGHFHLHNRKAKTERIRGGFLLSSECCPLSVPFLLCYALRPIFFVSRVVLFLVRYSFKDFLFPISLPTAINTLTSLSCEPIKPFVLYKISPIV